MRQETRKVAWPDGQAVRSNAVVVSAVLLGVLVLLLALDILFGWSISQLFGR